MSGPQHSGHTGHGHPQASLPQAFEAPDNKIRLDLGHHYFEEPRSLPEIVVGRATYSFTVGDTGVPHVYTAEVTVDGKIIHEKVYYMRDSQHIVETKIGANLIAQFEQFALADIRNARKTSIDHHVQVHADVSRANNQPRWKQLSDAIAKDAQSILQQRIPKKP